jgi:ligand-binding SRPBCC domain-containing protein
MSLHTLSRVQTLPITIQEAWAFFSSPLNLSLITPPEMKFHVLSKFKPGDQIFKDMLIDYRVSPLFGIPMSWQTKITEVNAPHYFVDEQLKGPYAYWHHEHHFREVKGGTEMTDLVQWRVPLGWAGDVVNELLVRKRVQAIFDFREKKLTELYGSKEQRVLIS